MVEMMVGVTILSIALLSSVPLVLSSDKMSALIAEGHTARTAARQKMDELRAVDFSTLDSYQNTGFHIDLDQDGKPDLQAVSGESHAGRVFVDHVPGISANPDTRRIRIVLRWRGARGTREYRLFSIRTEY